jgi:hypothetical protein
MSGAKESHAALQCRAPSLATAKIRKSASDSAVNAHVGIERVVASVMP